MFIEMNKSPLTHSVLLAELCLGRRFPAARSCQTRRGSTRDAYKVRALRVNTRRQFLRIGTECASKARDGSLKNKKLDASHGAVVGAAYQMATAPVKKSTKSVE